MSQHRRGLNVRGQMRKRRLVGKRLVASVAVQARRLKVAQLFAQLALDHAAGRLPKPPGGIQKLIAAQLGVNHTTVGRDVKALNLEWQEHRADAIDVAKSTMLVELDWVKAEAKTEWERSKHNAEQVAMEQEVEDVVDEATGVVTRVRHGRATEKKLTKYQRGDTSYLQVVLAVETDRRKILGLDQPQKRLNFHVDLSQLSDDQLDRLANGEPLDAVLALASESGTGTTETLSGTTGTTPPPGSLLQ
jgi:hypothetical protein